MKKSTIAMIIFNILVWGTVIIVTAQINKTNLEDVMLIYKHGYYQGAVEFNNITKSGDFDKAYIRDSAILRGFLRHETELDGTKTSKPSNN